MGGSSSASKSSSSSNSTSTKNYGTTTTTNPYVTSTTNNSGTTTAFTPNSALESVYNFTNANIDNLLNQYLNPSVENPTSQAQLNAFTKTLNNETRKNLENNVITPLAQRNMIRSSQATDLYNNLSKQQNDAISDYTTSLLANNQQNTADIINNLMNNFFMNND